MIIEELKKVKWDSDSYEEFLNLLDSIGEEQYGAFNAKIIPNLGFSYNVRMPILRKISRLIEKNEDKSSFYNFVSVGNSYEEKLLQGMLLSKTKFKSSSEMYKTIEFYAERINNWALCDSFATSLRKLVEDNKKGFFEKIKEYTTNKNPWKIRLGLVLLNNYFVEDEYLDDIFTILRNVKNEEYYVNMAVAWLVSTCFIKNKEKTREFISSGYLTDWCKKKSIQKIIESLRVSDLEKKDAKTLL